MRKILLISDTHGYVDEGLFKYIKAADEVWHGGDIGTLDVCDKVTAHKPLRAVHGNIDGREIRAIYPEVLFFSCEAMKILITHIGGYPGKYPANIKQLIREKQPDIFICGHSHIVKVMYDQSLKHLHMNPGACGNQGFHVVKTALRFEVENAEIKNLAVIELGKRSSLPL